MTRTIFRTATLALATAAGALAAPATVSPGGSDEMLPATSGCPTFSWGALANGSSHELAVFELPDGAEPASPALAAMLELAPLRLGQKLPPGATSWTPPANRCLERGRRYAWFLRAVEGEDWSPPRFFEVTAASELERAVEQVLARFLAERRISLPEAAAFADNQGVPGAERPRDAGGSSTGTRVLPPTVDGEAAFLARQSEGPGVAPRFGAKAVTESIDPGSAALLGHAPATTGVVYGVHGVTASEAGRGVAGEVTASSGTNYGVYGSTASDEGVAVYGVATKTNGANVGVGGASRSADGLGGEFVSEAAGGTALYAEAADKTGADLLLGADLATDDRGLIRSAGDLELEVGAGRSIKLGSDDVSVDDAGNVTAKMFFGDGSALAGVTPDDLDCPAPCVDGAEIEDGAVTTAEIADATIKLEDIASNGCTMNQVMAGDGSGGWKCLGITPAPDTVGTLELINDSVETADIKNGTILFADVNQNGCSADQVMQWNGAAWICSEPTVAAGAITSTQIQDETIQAIDIGPNAVGASELANSSVDSAAIVDGQVKAVDVDSAQVQERVGGVCAAGSSIRAIGSNGNVTCETDDKLAPAVSLEVSVATGGLSFLGTANGSRICFLTRVDSIILGPGGRTECRTIISGGNWFVQSTVHPGGASNCAARCLSW